MRRKRCVPEIRLTGEPLRDNSILWLKPENAHGS